MCSQLKPLAPNRPVDRIINNMGGDRVGTKVGPLLEPDGEE